jgi:outer membrane protein assembly factor BamB
MWKLKEKYSDQTGRMSGTGALVARALKSGFVCLLVCLVCSAQSVGQQLVFSQPLIARWQYTTAATINFRPAAFAGQVYLPLAAGRLVALSAADGQLLWQTDLGGEISAAAEADEHGVYIATETITPDGTQTYYRATGALRALSGKSGVTLWMRTLPRPFSSALTANATTLFGGTTDGRVYAISKANGEVEWQAQYTAPFASQPVLHDGRLYLGSEDGALLVFDEQHGHILWHYQTRGSLRGPVALANQLVLFGSADGYVYALNEATGRLRWRARTGAGVQAVAATDAGLVVASLDNFVYLLSYRHGQRVWKRQLAGRISAQPLTSTDSALFVPLGGDACVVLALRDGKTVNTLEVGPDGNTSASPIVAADVLLITTRHGLMAYAVPTASTRQP